ncbi:MAG: HesA/MoeB/ThiF family protein [Candidatus Nanoarchaeia archaeon]
MHKYKAQMLLPGIGEAGQKKIKKACVAIVGLGAIGSLTSEYLARAGVGNLILIDRDKVEELNLHRQILYAYSDVGKSKVVAAKRELLRANPDVKIKTEQEYLSEKNVSSLLKGADLVLDCSDNMLTRKIINNYCVKQKKIWIHAAASGARCNVLVLDEPSDFSRYFGASSLDCSENAILGPAAGLAACIQSAEALKVIVGMPYFEHLQRFDLWKNRHDIIRVGKK